MTHKRKTLRIMALVLISALTMSLTAWAVDETNADRLHHLGLFQGTGSGYALDRTATRMQGLIMLTRLLGEEKAALDSTASCPFTDVAAGNPSKYAAYGYEKGYTTGTSATTFSPGNIIGFRHYVTFLLRALGYDDGAGDFSFSTSLDKAVEIGMMDAESAALIAAKQPAFYRADLVDLSISALTLNLKDSSDTLAKCLVDRGVFSYEDAVAQKVLDCGKATYHYQQPPEKPAPAQSPIARNSGAYALPSGTVRADVITVNLKDAGVRVRTDMVRHQLGATAKFADIVAASQADVVINGNFFESYNPSKFPIGHVMVDGEFLYGVSGLSAVGFTGDGEIRIGRPAVFFYVEGDGCSWACYELNSQVQSSDNSTLYTPAFGATVTLTCDGVVTTVCDGVIQSSQTSSAGTAVSIPQNGYVMFFGTGFASTNYYREPVVGTSVVMTPRMTREDGSGFALDGVEFIVSGAPRLVENGAVCTTLEPGFQEARFTSAVSPRTAIGKAADGKLVIVSTSAASIQQMRELMLQLGCTDAVNLDGGASTALAYQGKIVRNAGRPLTTTLQVFVEK